MAAERKYTLQEWRSGEEMHEDAKTWISELEFITGEHLFFEELLGTYFIRISTEEHFREGKGFVEELEVNRAANAALLNRILPHNNSLEVFLDGKNELEKEDLVRSTHKELEKAMRVHHRDYRTLKHHIFKLIGAILKEIRKDHLLGP